MNGKPARLHVAAKSHQGALTLDVPHIHHLPKKNAATIILRIPLSCLP